MVTPPASTHVADERVPKKDDPVERLRQELLAIDQQDVTRLVKSQRDNFQQRLQKGRTFSAREIKYLLATPAKEGPKSSKYVLLFDRLNPATQKGLAARILQHKSAKELVLHKEEANALATLLKDAKPGEQISIAKMIRSGTILTPGLRSAASPTPGDQATADPRRPNQPKSALAEVDAKDAYGQLMRGTTVLKKGAGGGAPTDPTPGKGPTALATNKLGVPPPATAVLTGNPPPAKAAKPGTTLLASADSAPEGLEKFLQQCAEGSSRFLCDLFSARVTVPDLLTAMADGAVAFNRLHEVRRRNDQITKNPGDSKRTDLVSDLAVQRWRDRRPT